jgi:hypothetical protein
MQPLGRKKIRFPSKTKEWLRKGVKMWWEEISEQPNKKRERRLAKQEAKQEAENAMTLKGE